MSDDKDNIVKLRDERNRFIKGGVGNPEGKIGPVREKALLEKMTVGQMYRAHAVEVFEALLALIQSPAIAPTAKIAAIKEFNTRALGNPSSTTILKTSAEADSETVDLTGLDLDMVRNIVDRANSK